MPLANRGGRDGAALSETPAPIGQAPLCSRIAAATPAGCPERLLPEGRAGPCLRRWGVRGGGLEASVEVPVMAVA